MTNESSMKYFITQVVASLLLLISFISLNYQNKWTRLLSIALLLKIGAAPLHLWLPQVIEGIAWSNILILGTLQKIAPIIVISYHTREIFTLFLVCSVIIGSLIRLNQTRTKKFLAYSAINHTGWILSAIFFRKFIWRIYFSIYSILMANTVWIFKILNINHIQQTLFSIRVSKKLILILNLWNLAGIPPFLGFWPKWLTTQTLVINEWFVIAFVIIFFTLVIIFVYTRVLINTILLKTFEVNFWKENYFSYRNLLLNFFVLRSLVLNVSVLFFL